MSARIVSFGIGLLFAAGPALAGDVATRTISHDAVTLRVLDQGHGPCVMMIPSLGRGAGDFDDLAGRVAAAGYRVLRLQPRGIGGSTGPMSGLAMRDLASDVAHAITGSGEHACVVLGHADGNRVARATAAYFPDTVSAVILLAAGGKVKPDTEAWTALRAVFDDKLSPAEHLKDVQTAFFAPGNDPAVWRDGWYPQTAEMERVAATVTPVDDWWTAGSAPVLVIQANQDRIAPPQNADLLKADIGARAAVVRIDGAGHAMLPEQPDAIARAVIAYLQARK